LAGIQTPAIDPDYQATECIFSLSCFLIKDYDSIIILLATTARVLRHGNCLLHNLGRWNRRKACFGCSSAILLPNRRPKDAQIVI